MPTNKLSQSRIPALVFRISQIATLRLGIKQIATHRFRGKDLFDGWGRTQFWATDFTTSGGDWCRVVKQCFTTRHVPR